MTAEAVFARCLSALKDERVRANEVYGDETDSYRCAENDIGAIYRLREEREHEKIKPVLENLRQALYAAKIISYAQGLLLMRSAAETYKWKLDYGGIASIWRGGCIIRSAFLTKISEAFERNPRLENLLLDGFFTGEMKKAIGGLRMCVSYAAQHGLPCPALMSALSWFDGWRCERLPANLLQAMRDYFGAHTYERIDRPRGETYHTEW
jgi:6-phosphogluconate dehydrogenase